MTMEKPRFRVHRQGRDMKKSYSRQELANFFDLAENRLSVLESDQQMTAGKIEDVNPQMDAVKPTVKYTPKLTLTPLSSIDRYVGRVSSVPKIGTK